MMYQAHVIANKVYKGRNFSGFWEFNLEWSCYGKSWMSLDFYRNGDEGYSIPCPPPKLSSLWQCLDAHFDAFLDICPETYEHDYGFLRPIIPEVVGKFMGCGVFPTASPATRPNMSSRSLNSGSMTHSPATTTNRCLRKTGNLRTGKLRTGESYFPSAHPPNPAF